MIAPSDFVQNRSKTFTFKRSWIITCTTRFFIIIFFCLWNESTQILNWYVGLVFFKMWRAVQWLCLVQMWKYSHLVLIQFLAETDFLCQKTYNFFFTSKTRPFYYSRQLPKEAKLAKWFYCSGTQWVEKNSIVHSYFLFLVFSRYDYDFLSDPYSLLLLRFSNNVKTLKWLQIL
jgi:hypothetical protein